MAGSLDLSCGHAGRWDAVPALEELLRGELRRLLGRLNNKRAVTRILVYPCVFAYAHSYMTHKPGSLVLMFGRPAVRNCHESIDKQHTARGCDQRD